MLALRRSRLFAVLLLVAAPAAGAPSVVVGVTPVEADATALLAIDLDDKDAPPRPLGEVHHRTGHAPVGVVIDDRHVALVVEVGNRSDGLLIRKDLATGAETSLLDEVVPTHTPLLWRRPDGGSELVAVRLRDETTRGGTFDVVGVDALSGASTVRASGQRLWVTPAHGYAPGLAPAFLVIDGAPPFSGPVSRGEKTGDGHAHLDVVIDGILVTRARLGPGSFRSPVRHGDELYVEHAVEPGRTARLIDARGVEQLRGRPGLSPVVSSSGRFLAASSSKKDGSVVVRERGRPWQTLQSGRAGIARPLLALEGDAGVVIVAWLDRGVSLPGELWRIDGTGGRLLLPAAARTAVTVHGAIGAAPSSPSPTTTPAPAPSSTAPTGPTGPTGAR